MTVTNLFRADEEPIYWAVAERLLTGRPASFDDLCFVAQIPQGKRLSTVTLHLVIAMIEDQGGLMLRRRDRVYGTLYHYLPNRERTSDGERLTSTGGTYFQDRTKIVERWRAEIEDEHE